MKTGLGRELETIRKRAISKGMRLLSEEEILESKDAWKPVHNDFNILDLYRKFFVKMLAHVGMSRLTNVRAELEALFEAGEPPEEY